MAESGLPDDFFADLADENFIGQVFERGVVEESDDDLNTYVEEIHRLQNDINKRRQLIKETEENLKADSRRMSRSRSRSSSRSRSRRRRLKGESSNKRRRSRSPDNRRRSRSPSPQSSRHAKHSRYDELHREKRYPLSPIRTGRPLRRSRSKSPSSRHRAKRSTSNHRSISFLEELAQKFAEKGQAFPERDALLMGGNNHLNPVAIDNQPMPMNFGNVMPFDQPIGQPPMINIPNFPQQPIDFGQSQNMYYGINPMSILAGNSVPQAFPPPIQLPEVTHDPQLLPQQPIPIDDPITSNNQRALIDRCEQAIKLIRAKDNKVPVMKFQYNRTSMVVSNDLAGGVYNKASPLQAHSTLNATFKLNAPTPNAPITNTGLKMLPKRVKDVASALGINCEFLFEKMRSKELTAQIADQINQPAELDTEPPIGEILIQTTTNPHPVIETADIGIQTPKYECNQCTERNKRTMINANSQTYFRGISIGVQTNERDYREPIVELLSRMTAAQLVAIKDFANIIDEPLPRNRDEMYKVRERLMDIYNLSQRDADVVNAVEDNRMDDAPFMEQSYRNRGDMYNSGEGTSRDFDRRSKSPRFSNGSNMCGRNFEPNDFMMNERNVMDDRQRFVQDDRFRGTDSPYQQRMRSQDIDEEMQRKRYLEMERQRELELEISQRRYEEQRMIEQERLAAAMQANFLQRPKPPDDDDRDMVRQNVFNSNNRLGGGSGTLNKRGRGAFRDNFRGGRGGGGRR